MIWRPLLDTVWFDDHDRSFAAEFEDDSLCGNHYRHPAGWWSESLWSFHHWQLRLMEAGDGSGSSQYLGINEGGDAAGDGWGHGDSYQTREGASTIHGWSNGNGGQSRAVGHVYADPALRSLVEIP